MDCDSIITIFGGSTAYGKGDDVMGGWANRLRMAFEDEGMKVRVYNLGIMNETTEDTLERFHNEMRARYDASKNNIVVFSLGLNDSISYGSVDKVPLNLFTKNIQELIQHAKNYTPKIAFIGLHRVDEGRTTPVFWDRHAHYYNDKITQFDDYLKNICDETGTQYIEVASILNPIDLCDGLHPNADGHKKIVERIKTQRRYG